MGTTEHAREAPVGLWAMTEKTTGTDEAHNFLRLRDAGPGEEEAFREALRVLGYLLSDGNPLTSVLAARDDLTEAVCEALVAMVEAPDHGRSLGSKIVRRFNDWLAAVRSLDDKLHAWVSREWGKDSDSWRAFDVALSVEWEQNAAYRYATALRNVSLHASGSVLNRAEVRFDDGWELWLAFDTQVLAAQNGGRINAKVRDEWALIEEDVHMLPVVAHATNGCVRAFAALIDSVSEELDEHHAYLVSRIEECEEASGEWAVIGAFRDGGFDDMALACSRTLVTFDTARSSLQPTMEGDRPIESTRVCESPKLRMPGTEGR